MPDQARSMDGWHLSAIGVRFLQGGEGPHGAHRAWSHSTRKARPRILLVFAAFIEQRVLGGTCQILWEDSERVFHRGWRLDDDGKRRAVLLVAPAADHQSRSMLPPGSPTTSFWRNLPPITGSQTASSSYLPRWVQPS